MAIKIIVSEMSGYDSDHLNERMRWCNQNIGKRNVAWKSTVCGNNQSLIEYSFEDEASALLFALKWL